MPIYDYVCESCGHVMEVSHGIDAMGPTECPECGGLLAKAFAAPAIHFRGSGWAKKDRRSVSGPIKKKAGSDAGGSAEQSGGAGAAEQAGRSGAAEQAGGSGAGGSGARSGGASSETSGGE